MCTVKPAPLRSIPVAAVCSCSAAPHDTAARANPAASRPGCTLPLRSTTSPPGNASVPISAGSSSWDRTTASSPIAETRLRPAQAVEDAGVMGQLYVAAPLPATVDVEGAGQRLHALEGLDGHVPQGAAVAHTKHRVDGVLAARVHDAAIAAAGARPDRVSLEHHRVPAAAADLRAAASPV